MKIVDNPHYHIWTDALHARALAQQASNRWDKGAYVRWALTTAWTAFEVACEDALNVSGLGNRFKSKVDDELVKKSLPALDWGQGLWQNVLKIYSLRKEYVHQNISQSRLFANVAEADEAIHVLRDAIRTIYNYVGKAIPSWVDDDYDRGWDKGINPFAHGKVLHQGAKENDPGCIKIAYVYKDYEYISDVFHPGTDTKGLVDDLLQRLQAPVTSVRVYQGSTLVEERNVQIRGA